MPPAPPAARRGMVLLVAAMLLWSTAEVVIRTTNGLIGPVQLAWCRFTFGGLFLLCFLPAHLRRERLRIGRRIVLHTAWLSVIGVAGSAITYQYALLDTGAAIVATVIGATPMFVFLMSRTVLGEPLTAPRALGVTLGFAGIAVLSLSERSATYTPMGLVFTVANMIGFAVYTVFVKRLAGSYAGLPVTVLSFLWGGAIMLPLMLAEDPALPLAHAGALALPVAYLSIVTTGIAYWLYFAGLAQVDATQAISVILLKPPVATALAAAVLGEPIGWNLAAALALILGGLYLVVALQRRRAD